MRAQALWVSVEEVGGVRIVQCHAIIDVVIDVRVMECHASMDVVIGVRVMLCHQAIDHSGFSTFLNFHFVSQFSTCCHVVAIHHHFSLLPFFSYVFHCILTAFKVWYLHSPSVTVDRCEL